MCRAVTSPSGIGSARWDLDGGDAGGSTRKKFCLMEKQTEASGVQADTTQSVPDFPPVYQELVFIYL